MCTRRKSLDHGSVPFAARWNAEFYVTICCVERHRNVLCTGEIGPRVMESARLYERTNRWRVGLLVLMPDHLHGIFRFPYEQNLALVVSDWKRYLARTHAIAFQRDFFGHRIRSDESYHDKVQYILHNPIRAGLVRHWQDRPYVIHRTGCDGAEPVG